MEILALLVIWAFLSLFWEIIKFVLQSALLLCLELYKAVHRLLGWIGTVGVVIAFILFLGRYIHNPKTSLLMPVLTFGYIVGWIGHFFVTEPMQVRRKRRSSHDLDWIDRTEEMNAILDD